MKKNIIKSLVFTSLCLIFAPRIFAQVDKTQPASDTLIIYEEEIIYDTLYLQSSQTDKQYTKDELLEIFQKSGIGQIYYGKGRYWLTGNDEIYTLDNTDLQKLFTPAQYETYRKAKRNQYISIPLYVVGGSAAAVGFVGLVQYCSSLVQMVQAGNQMRFNDNIMTNIWKSTMGGFLVFGGSMLVATGCIVPAAILTIKSKVQLKNLADDFNKPDTALKLSFGTTPMGMGLTISF